MEALDRLAGGADAALLILTFLQADSRSSQYRDELLRLGRDLGLAPGGCPQASPDEGHLETDGSGPSCVVSRLSGGQAAVAAPGLDEAAVRQAAEELRDIADRLDRSVLAEAAQNLRRNLQTSTPDRWEDQLSREVSRVMRQSVTLKDVAQECVTVALTLALVKGVCELTPQLMRDLFSSTLRYIGDGRAR